MNSAFDEVEVAIETCRETAKIPQYARKGDAGMDVFAAQDVVIAPGETVVVPTGLKVAIPVGYEIQVRPRSGLSLKTPLRISNSPGTIDSGYRDEIGIIITNTSDKSDSDNMFTVNDKGNMKGTYIIKTGDRIAQLVLQAVPRIKFLHVESVECIGENRGGGFGSTGLR